MRTFNEIKTKKFGLQEKFNDELSDNNLNHLDRASRNLGVYKNKLVLFDW